MFGVSKGWSSEQLLACITSIWFGLHRIGVATLGVIYVPIFWLLSKLTTQRLYTLCPDLFMIESLGGEQI